MIRARLLLALLLATVAVGQTHAADVHRQPGESDIAFASRVLRLSSDADPHVTAAAWDGAPTLFVDYLTAGDEPERPLVALQRQAAGDYRLIRITVGEEEGGAPDVAGIGFAAASRSPQKDLIVILAWPQRHYDVEGTLYEVRLFAPPKPGQESLKPMKISDRFGSGCDCGWRDGTSKRYPFKTIAAVKAELRKLGY